MPAAAVLQVALPLPLPRCFDYLPADGLAADADAIGCRVRVPFGSRSLTGVVAGTGAPEGEAELRAIEACLDPEPLFHGELLQSLRWLARYTHAPLGEVLATALPAALRRGEPLPDTHAWAWQLTEAGATALPGLRQGKPQQLAQRLQAGACDEDVLDANAGEGWRSAARSLAKRGLAERVAVPASQLAPAPQPGPAPNAEQQAAIDAVLAARDGFAPIMLDGVTGSGKTEVYLHAIADCLARGKQALVLVPEIGLTPQMLARFRARLGVPVHALHSGLNDNERARVWTAAWRGEARVIVGTRSAVFLPLPDAGLIVIDEEHDASYKQLDGIRYHARDFALVRGKALAVPVLLGSATPSLESLHNARAGRYAHLRLHRRAGDAQAPTVRIIDVRKRPLQAGLSPEALDAIAAALAAGGQVLVFKNRRGYAPVLLCHDCGWSAHCRRCDAAMTVHAGGRRLQCHHCGARQPVPNACPDCASLALQPQGIGTERLEELLIERFGDTSPTAHPERSAAGAESKGRPESVRPERSAEGAKSKGQTERDAATQGDPSTPALRAYAQGERKSYPILRIDRGTTRRRDALQAHMDQLSDQPGILVGTQMLAKGHDLPRLTLVVVVGIDEGLFSADFRAGEKLAQLLIQVAGRAGRAERAGNVLLQTHHPGHPLLETLLQGGYHAFVQAELAAREQAGFPPFAHLALLRAEAKHTGLPMDFLQSAKSLLHDATDDLPRPPRTATGHGDDASLPPARGGKVPKADGGQALAQQARTPTPELHGPLPAPMPRRAGFHRAQLLLASPNRRTLHATLDAALPAIHALPEARKLRWSLDVDPVDLY